MTGNLEAVRQHIAAGTNLDVQHEVNKSTALIVAATFGKTATSLALIEGGADLEAKNSDGATALQIAAFLCREEVVKALIAAGANLNSRDNSNTTALESVSGPFEQVKPIYDLLQATLGPYGLNLDYDHLKNTRPKIAEILSHAEK